MSHNFPSLSSLTLRSVSVCGHWHLEDANLLVCQPILSVLEQPLPAPAHTLIIRTICRSEN